MADLVRYLRDIQGWAASLEVSNSDTLQMLADMRRGHPKAQDFEPTGHGGSDPTALNGAKTDRFGNLVGDPAVLDGKRYTAAIKRAHDALREAEDIRYRYRRAVKPERKADDLDDVWCVIHWQLGYPEPHAHLDLCSSCYKFKANHNGEYPTKEDVEYYITHYGRWPAQRIDPKNPVAPMKTRRIAGLENLQDGLATLQEGTA